MRLKVVGSGSSGNSYILETADCSAALVIECGLQFREIKRALGYRLDNVVGCLLTHEHGDHASAAHHILAAGVPLFSTNKTHRQIGTHGKPGAVALEKMKPVEIGPFKVIAFDVKHNAVDPVGFLIQHAECGTVLFATDTYFLKYTFPGLNNILIEANYCENFVNSQETPVQSNYLSHMSIQQTLRTLEANDLAKVNNIVLIHLSNGNSHARRFKRQVEEQTGKTVLIADKGLEIEFNLTPF